MGKVIEIGETVLDIIFRNDRPDTATPGDSTFNAMIFLAFLNERNDADYDIALFGSSFAVNPKIRRYTKTLLEEAAGNGASQHNGGRLHHRSRRQFQCGVR